MLKQKYVKLACGKMMAYERWGNHNAKHKVLCCHGWLDNANSFSFLGPILASKGDQLDVIAIDHLGHGLSDHISEGMQYLYPAYVSNVKSFLDELEWSNVSLIGHSMSSGISMLFAGIYPERVNKLCLIDGLGPLTTTAEKTPALLRKAIDQEIAFFKRKDEKKVYENIAKAIQARVRNVASYPGSQTLSLEAAASLVSRGTKLVNSDDDADINESNPDPVIFRHDVRLFLSSYSYFSNEQILHFIDGITSKTLLIQGRTGWPAESNDILLHRKKHFKDLLTHVILEGSHHLHLDPDSRVAVANEIFNFLKQE